MSNKKTVRLQHRTYLGADHITQYTQHRINIPETIIQKLGWVEENQITISIESKHDKKRIILQTKEE